ncbi:hypothetical protein MIPYR_30215 [uncultured Microbacterium sp.]|uniref:Uncharacterized protein n=1 Tax=uncultured Microbacterium sp. TaxID=191216 RepID=A0A1Y5PA41_9MICO|nr:hypothetical protein MIPYR_30215 [uncultured Microbacterium sp.]
MFHVKPLGSRQFMTPPRPFVSPGDRVADVASRGMARSALLEPSEALRLSTTNRRFT